MGGKVVSTSGAPEAIGPYSQAIISGDLLFCSGQIGIDPASGELAESLEAQVKRAFQNLASVLQAAGAGFEDVVRMTVYLASMDDFAAMNQIYAGLFTQSPPARSTIAAKTLPRNALFEVDAIATLPKRAG